MQLHQAATQYQQHLDQLLESEALTAINSDVWRVKYDTVAEGYYLQLDNRVGEHLNDDDPAYDKWDTWVEDYQDLRLITKQRGGKRIFRTLDAVASALQQIGQPKLPLDELPKPSGL